MASFHAGLGFGFVVAWIEETSYLPGASRHVKLQMMNRLTLSKIGPELRINLLDDVDPASPLTIASLRHEAFVGFVVSWLDPRNAHGVIASLSTRWTQSTGIHGRIRSRSRR